MTTDPAPDPPGETFTLPGPNRRTLTNVHRREDCTPPCVIHAPSDHHLAHLPLHWRDDRRIFERICPHGVGHPDPDTTYAPGDDDTHGCDGCCAAPDQEDAEACDRAGCRMWRERLTAERDAARAERDEARQDADCAREWELASSYAARAEAARLREALLEITDTRPCEWYGRHCITHGEKRPCSHGAAQAVLTTDQEPDRD